MDKDKKPEFTDEWITQVEDEHRENQSRLEAMNIWRTSEEVILDNTLTKVTRDTLVSESPN